MIELLFFIKIKEENKHCKKNSLNHANNIFFNEFLEKNAIIPENLI